MRLSALQRSILLHAFDARPPIPRAAFRSFFIGKARPAKPKDRENDLTRSLERLIDRGLLSGYGRRTPRKWFLDSVRLTPSGRALARRQLGQQQRLPLRLSRSRT